MVCLVLVCSSCGDGGVAAGQADAGLESDADPGTAIDGGGNAIAGSVQGEGFGPIVTSYWIGKTDVGSAPVQFYLSDAARDCAALGVSGWDKTLGDKHLLEVGLTRAEVGPYLVLARADANYLRGNVNPSATSGTVTVDAVEPSASIRGSFTLMFGADKLHGTFDASYCATGVEP